MKPLSATDPREVGPYRLLARLGGGGMGRVFLGRSPGGLTVAVKLVRPELAEDTRFRRRFAQEIEAARRVGGFYTAQVVDADAAADPPWMVTSYIPGPSLGEVVARHGPLPLATVSVLGAEHPKWLTAPCGLLSVRAPVRDEKGDQYFTVLARLEAPVSTTCEQAVPDWDTGTGKLSQDFGAVVLCLRER
ncbi:hypothetical protein [Kitasatospora purpeofusca]|uniref:hypothetical protein n=1 Tax=Kitasatospora purpeofusca TaxID=67352 RepID=UPI003F63E047